MDKSVSQYLDSAYVRRCQKRLMEWDAPLSGWQCIYIYDVKEEEDDAPLFTCELCDCAKVRFVHVMHHDQYFEDLHVGCICAGIMEDDILAARERERVMKNRAKRRRNFPYRRWRTTRYGYYLSYKRKDVFIYGKGNSNYSVRVNGKTVCTYKGKMIDNFFSAAYAAFDLADPVETA